jgi:hypothetical protein
MKQYSTTIIASLLALALAAGIFARMNTRKRQFDRTVEESLKVTAQYDQQFIDLVSRLEEELATRASFGYKGGKDPMTGRRRRVVLPRRRPKKRAPKKQEFVDPVKLTAIIFDDVQKKFTAIVMDGERSFSVEVGDRVGDRKILQISDETVIMANDSLLFRYDIYGASSHRKR